MRGGQRQIKARTRTRESQGASRERRRGSITPLSRGHQGGGVEWCVDDDHFPGVEISIAGGLEQMVHG